MQILKYIWNCCWQHCYFCSFRLRYNFTFPISTLYANPYLINVTQRSKSYFNDTSEVHRNILKDTEAMRAKKRKLRNCTYQSHVSVALCHHSSCLHSKITASLISGVKDFPELIRKTTITSCLWCQKKKEQMKCSMWLNK